MMKRFFACFALAAAVGLSACGTENTTTPDNFLSYRHKAIEPYCFGMFLIGDSSRFEEPVSLATCTDEGHSTYASYLTQENGRYSQQMKRVNSPWPEHMFFNYRLVAGTAENFVVEVHGNTGGSGNFSNVIVVRREGDELHLLEEMGAGDRCNGGITGDVQQREDGTLVYSRFITPADLYASEEMPEDKTLTELEFCAVCCTGMANYEGEALVSYTLTPQNPFMMAEDYVTEAIEGEGVQQACFNRSLVATLKGEAQTFSKEHMQSFLQKTAQACRAE